MGTFGDPVGRALLEHSVRRISSVSYDFEVTAKTLQELGELAQRKAVDLYGDHSFVITSMSVHEDGTTYRARVYTEIV